MNKANCKIELITHACATISDNRSRIIFDPWFFGTAFNDGWKLPNEVDITRTSLDTITHTCITHEHPDHFHIPTLKRINDEWNPIFLIQETSDRRMANYIRKVLGKKVIELRDGQRYAVSPSISIEIYSHGHMDSFALVKAENNYILNINDCVLKTKRSLEHVRKRIKNRKIDVLMSQYSFASYSGNAEESRKLKQSAKQHLEWIEQRSEFFQPQVFVPFASGIEWCASENKYLNEFSVKASDVEKTLLQTRKPPAVLKPYTNHTILFNNLEITSKEIRHDEKEESAKIQIVKQKDSREQRLLDEIEEISARAKKELDQKNHMWTSKIMKILGAIRILEKILVEIQLESGQKEYYELSPGLIIKKLEKENKELSNKYENEIAMKIDSLAYCFLNQYGAETLWVNSRFRIKKGKAKSFFKHFYCSILTNQGFSFPLGYVRFAWTRILAPRLLK